MQLPLGIMVACIPMVVACLTLLAMQCTMLAMQCNAPCLQCNAPCLQCNAMHHACSAMQCTMLAMQCNAPCLCSEVREVGFEPGPPNRQSSTQTTMPIELSSIDRAVLQAGNGWGLHSSPRSFERVLALHNFTRGPPHTMHSCSSRKDLPEGMLCVLPTTPECSEVREAGFEPRPPNRQSSMQTTMPIELSSIGRAVLRAGNGWGLHLQGCMFHHA